MSFWSYKEEDRDECLSLRLRQSDMNELQASGYETVREALTASIEQSNEIYVIQPKDRIIGIFGVAQGELYGIPWMVATDEIYRHAVELCRTARGLVKNWKEHYGTLANCVDSRNTASHRWLKSLGFAIREDIVFGEPYYKVPFYLFHQ